jgi:hypothetical protein
MKFAAWYVTRWEPEPRPLSNTFCKRQRLSKLEAALFETPREYVQEAPQSPINKDGKATPAFSGRALQERQGKRRGLEA